MSIYFRVILLICFWICFESQPAFSCKYNIREIGFVDMGSDLFYFYGYINSNTPEEITLSFNQILHSAFSNCNINAEIIDIDRQRDHQALKYLSLWKIQSFPAVILVSPDGRSLVIQINNQDSESFRKSLKSAINDIIFSPIREEIIKGSINNHSVILLIESENPRENEKYMKAALSAIGYIKSQMNMLVKAIDYPPILISMKPESFPDEKILLWSLGLDTDIKEPHAAIFYGKARWIGPLMKADEITDRNLENILSVIGLDCECGLDVSWVEGTMLPVKWDQSRQSQVARLLEFDPENPLVKLEVNRILKMGTASYPGVSVISSDSSIQSYQVSDGYIIDKEKSFISIPFYFILGFTALIAVIGLIIFIVKFRKN